MPSCNIYGGFNSIQSNHKSQLFPSDGRPGEKRRNHTGVLTGFFLFSFYVHIPFNLHPEELVRMQSINSPAANMTPASCSSSSASIGGLLLARPVCAAPEVMLVLGRGVRLRGGGVWGRAGGPARHKPPPCCALRGSNPPGETSKRLLPLSLSHTHLTCRERERDGA